MMPATVSASMIHKELAYEKRNRGFTDAVHGTPRDWPFHYDGHYVSKQVDFFDDASHRSKQQY